MKNLIKIPWYIPLTGILIGFILIIVAANIPSMALLIAGLILLHLCVWVYAIEFFLIVFGFFSSILN